MRQSIFVTPGGRAVDMHYREGTSDWNTLNACMTEDEYRLRGRSLEGLALDIGGHIGGVGIGLAVDNPGLRVIMVEAVPQNVELARRNIASTGVGDRVTLVEGAVGFEGHPVTVWYGYRGTELAEHHAWIGNSSIAYDNGGEAEHSEITYDRPWSISRLLGLVGVERVALCKVDVEGAEYGFLDTRDVGLVDEFVGEWHPVRGHTRDNILALLSRTHAVEFSGPESGPGGFRAVRL